MPTSARSRGGAAHAARAGAAAARPAQRAQRAGGDRRRREAGIERRRDPRRRSPPSPASSAASPRPAPGTASRSIDDYGHHPVEIAAVLGRARRDRGRVIAVVEPHRYTRVRDLFDEFAACFKDADSVIVTAVYSAGEQPIDGIDREPGRGVCAARASPVIDRSTAERETVAALSAAPATWSSASAPATAPNGRAPAASLPSSGIAGARQEASVADLLRLWPRAAAICAAARCRTRRWRIHLVPRRRPRAGAVHAGRRGRPRLFPGDAVRPRSR